MMRDSDVQKEIDRLSKELTRHYTNTDNRIDFPNVVAGAVIHSDKGYSIGNQEEYEKQNELRKNKRPD